MFLDKAFAIFAEALFFACRNTYVEIETSF